MPFVAAAAAAEEERKLPKVNHCRECKLKILLKGN